jgi:phosphatidylglycerophosphate synthase
LTATRTPRLVLAAAAGALVARGWFAPAAAAVLAVAFLTHIASTRSARPGPGLGAAGAVVDASADRYEELLVLGGLALYFHSAAAPLALTLLAMSGAYMASYAIAKAQAHGAAPQGESADRPTHASMLIAGVALVPIAQLASTLVALPSWAAQAPLLLALAVVAVGGNASAIRRLLGVAASAQRHQGDHRPAALLDVHRGVAQHAARVDVHRVLPGRDAHSRDGDARGQRLPASRVGGV